MSHSNLAVAEAYYSAVESGDHAKMGSLLRDDVKYVDPQWPLTGKAQVLPIGRSFAAAIKQLKTVAKFSANDQVMLVHDVMFHAAPGVPVAETSNPLRTSVLMTFDGGLIKEIQLIANTSQHEEICKKIFTSPPPP
jgi:ketosteroid isomerase-like protein